MTTTSAAWPQGQEAIYYLTAEWLCCRQWQPALEALKAHGIEVLLMSDRIDEWMASYLTEYAGKKLRDVGKGDLDWASSAVPIAEKRKEAEKAAEGVVKKLKDLLGERVRDVRVSDAPDRFALVPRARRTRHGPGHAAHAETGRTRCAGRANRFWRSTRTMHW